MAWFRRDAHPEQQLSAYIDGELDARARRDVEAHLPGCKACSALAEELRRSKSLLAALPRGEPARSFVLGPEFAVQRRLEPRRSSFTFAPVAALTVLVVLLFVDAADFSGGSSSSSQDSAGASAFDAPAAARQANPAEKDDAAGAGTDGQQPVTAPAAAAAPESSPGRGPAPSAGGVNPTPGPPVAEDLAATPDEGERATLTVGDAEDNSDGISTLRVLEIVAALALVASLAFVYLPRIIGRRA
jgi:anti-sigma factor RsiW